MAFNGYMFVFFRVSPCGLLTINWCIAVSFNTYKIMIFFLFLFPFLVPDDDEGPDSKRAKSDSPASVLTGTPPAAMTPGLPGQIAPGMAMAPGVPGMPGMPRPPYGMPG